MRATFATCVIALVFLVAPPARAEEGEKSAGLEAALLLPGFDSSSATAFALATWSLGGFARYGLLDDLDLVARASFGAFRGSMPDTQVYFGRPIEGLLRFSASQLRCEVGARYKLFAGYGLAPYVELTTGALFSVFRDQQLLNEAGADYDLSIRDQRELSPTVGLGFAADYRVLNMFFVGLAVRYVQATSGRATRAVFAPLELSYYW